MPQNEHKSIAAPERRVPAGNDEGAPRNRARITPPAVTSGAETALPRSHRIPAMRLVGRTRRRPRGAIIPGIARVPELERF